MFASATAPYGVQVVVDAIVVVPSDLVSFACKVLDWG